MAICALTYDGGVRHPTVVGGAMGLVLHTTRHQGEELPRGRTEHLLRPLSAGVAVPLFALFAAGVSISAAALGEGVVPRAGTEGGPVMRTRDLSESHALREHRPELPQRTGRRRTRHHRNRCRVMHSALKLR